MITKEEKENNNIIPAEYQKGLNDHYLVIKNEQWEEDNYQLSMITENQIPYFLPLEIRSIDGRNDLYYRISSLQPIGKLFKNREMKLDDVRTVLMGLTRAFMTAQEYMLEEKHIVLLPDYIFMNTKDRIIQVLFDPYFEKETEESLKELADYLIVKIDHGDQDAVMMGYQFYRTVREDNFVIDDIVSLYTENYKRTSKDILTNGEITQSGKEYIFNNVNETGKFFDSEYQEEQEEYNRQYISQSDNGNNSLNDNYNGTNKKITLIVKTVISVVLSVISGVLLFGGIGPYRPNNMEKVIWGIIFLISILSIGMDIVQRFLKKSEKETFTNSKNYDHSMKSENNYDSIFADMQKRNIITESDMQKQEPSIKQDEQIIRSNLEDNKWEKNQDVIQNYIQKEEIYGKTVILTADSQMAENILVETKRGKETRHYIESFPYTIGKVKDQVDLVLSDISVSRIHARIIEENGQIYVQDCNSTNGTYVNGILLDKEEKIPIERDDEIGIGRITLLYQ